MDPMPVLVAYPAIGKLVSGVLTFAVTVAVYRLIISRLRQVAWPSAETGRRGIRETGTKE